MNQIPLKMKFLFWYSVFITKCFSTVQTVQWVITKNTFSFVVNINFKIHRLYPRINILKRWYKFNEKLNLKTKYCLPRCLFLLVSDFHRNGQAKRYAEQMSRPKLLKNVNFTKESFFINSNFYLWTSVFIDILVTRIMSH